MEQTGHLGSFQASQIDARLGHFSSDMVLEKDGAAREPGVLRVGEACSGHTGRKEPHRFEPRCCGPGAPHSLAHASASTQQCRGV